MTVVVSSLSLQDISIQFLFKAFWTRYACRSPLWNVFRFTITVEEEVDGINSIKEDEMIGNVAKGKVEEEMEVALLNCPPD